MAEPSPKELFHLREAKALRYSGLDLRFEGGPWLAELDVLVERGWLESHQHAPDYMVGYLLTPEGRSVLAAALGEGSRVDAE